MKYLLFFTLFALSVALTLTPEEDVLLKHFGEDEEVITNSGLTNDELDELLLKQVKAEKGVPDYLPVEDLRIMRKLGIDEVSVERAQIPQPVVEEELRHLVRDEIRHSQGIPDYLNKDEKTVLRYFKQSPLLLEQARIPREQIDQVLVEAIRAEEFSGDYLDNNIKAVMEHFGLDWREVEREHIPTPIVNEQLHKLLDVEDKDHLRPLNEDEKTVLEHFNYDVKALEESTLSRTAIDEELQKEIAREQEEYELNPDQIRLLNEFKRVRHVEVELGNSKKDLEPKLEEEQQQEQPPKEDNVAPATTTQADEVAKLNAELAPPAKTDDKQ